MMPSFKTLKEAAQFRVTESEDNYWVMDYWETAIDIFTKDVSATIKFLQDDCDDEEFYWLSEIFEEMVEKTQSRELVSALRARLARVTPEKYDQQSFKTEHMRTWVGYNKYVEDTEGEINYAENRIDE